MRPWQKRRSSGDAMKPIIGSTGFGYIEVGGIKIEHDIIVRLSGEVQKRRKKLSKAVYGTSHTISLAEAKHVYEGGAKRLIIGAGQNGMVHLSQEAADYFEKQQCEVELHPRPKRSSAGTTSRAR